MEGKSIHLLAFKLLFIVMISEIKSQLSLIPFPANAIYYI